MTTPTAIGTRVWRYAMNELKSALRLSTDEDARHGCRQVAEFITAERSVLCPCSDLVRLLAKHQIKLAAHTGILLLDVRRKR